MKLYEVVLKIVSYRTYQCKAKDEKKAYEIAATRATYEEFDEEDITRENIREITKDK